MTTASAFSLTALVPSDSFNVTKGDPVVGGLHKPDSRYMYCDWCKSWMFTEPVPDIGFISIRAMMFDTIDWFEPFIEVWVSEKLDWASVSAKHSFDKEPDLNRYRQLLSEYSS
ncbi:MAG: GFA family protein [Parasphingorhabdus sp.]